MEVRTELLDRAAARVSSCEGVGTIRHLSTKVLWPQQLVKRGIVIVSACTSAENRADLGTKSQNYPQAATADGVALDGTETSANGDGEDGQNETVQRGAAVRTISNPGQGYGGLLEAQENLVRAEYRDTDARCKCNKWLTRSTMTSGAGFSGSWSHKCMCGRLVRGCWQRHLHAIAFVVIAIVVTMGNTSVTLPNDVAEENVFFFFLIFG